MKGMEDRAIALLGWQLVTIDGRECWQEPDGTLHQVAEWMPDKSLAQCRQLVDLLCDRLAALTGSDSAK